MSSQDNVVLLIGHLKTVSQWYLRENSRKECPGMWHHKGNFHGNSRHGASSDLSMGAQQKTEISLNLSRHSLFKISRVHLQRTLSPHVFAGSSSKPQGRKTGIMWRNSREGVIQERLAHTRPTLSKHTGVGTHVGSHKHTPPDVSSSDRCHILVSLSLPRLLQPTKVFREQESALMIWGAHTHAAPCATPLHVT